MRRNPFEYLFTTKSFAPYQKSLWWWTKLGLFKVAMGPIQLMVAIAIIMSMDSHTLEYFKLPALFIVFGSGSFIEAFFYNYMFKFDATERDIILDSLTITKLPIFSFHEGIVILVRVIVIGAVRIFYPGFRNKPYEMFRIFPKIDYDA